MKEGKQEDWRKLRKQMEKLVEIKSVVKAETKAFKVKSKSKELSSLNKVRKKVDWHSLRWWYVSKIRKDVYIL